MMRHRKRERGIALLLTLGVLSLLLILAMSFAFNARTERMASAINADFIRARLLCESGLARALAYVRTSYDYPGTAAAADLFPATKAGSLFFTRTAAWDGRYYAVSMQATPDQMFIESALAVNLEFDFTPAWTNQRVDAGTHLHANESWHPVKADGNGDGDTTDPEDPLIGRMAFLIVDDSGKLDINAIISPDGEPYDDADSSGAWNAGEHFFDVKWNGGHDSGALSESTAADQVRSGGHLAEVRAGDAVAIATPNLLVNYLPASARRWFSWRHLRRSFTPAEMSDAVLQSATQAVCLLGYDIEAWRDAGADKHRFNLARDDWGSLGVDALVNSGSVSDFWIGSPATVNPATTDRIPWLSTLVDSGGNPVKNQVGANLIDYCDSDSIATSDYTAATGGWPLNPPAAGSVEPPSATYVGLEEVPYVNEVHVTWMFVEEDLSGPPPDGSGPWQCTLQLNVAVELINLYANSTSGDVALALEFSGALATLAPAPTGVAVPAGSPVPTASGARLVWSGVTVGAHGYTVLNGSVTYTWTPAGPGATYNIGVSDAAVTVTGGGGLADFARLPAAGAYNFVGPATSAACDWNVDDPRVNTLPGDWNVIALAAVAAGTTAPPYINPGANPSGRGGSDDRETVNDPADASGSTGMSTAYIRNAPMKSLWELGAIHRGEKWRTLNLRAYNAAAGAANAYSGGDANLLEQVKIGPYTEVQGKFNAHSPQVPAWRAMLSGITVGGTYDNPAGGTALTAGEINNLIPSPAAATGGTILATNGTTGATPAASRGGIARAGKLADGSEVTQDTDREQEEIIGKLANLLSARQNYFTVIVTAQVIRDLGALGTVPNQPGIIAWQDGGTTKYCRVLAEQKMMAIVYRDAFTNRFRIDRLEYLEE
jgi:hypothetical protein